MAPVKERQPALPYRTTADLESQLDHVRSAPADAGAVRLVVRRPDLGVREILEEGRFDPADGLVGDTWLARARSRAIADGRHFDAQVNVMSARMVALLADTAEEQAYAGDQLYLDLDLSHANLPTGSQLAFGEALAAAGDCGHPSSWHTRGQAQQKPQSEADMTARIQELNEVGGVEENF